MLRRAFRPTTTTFTTTTAAAATATSSSSAIALFSAAARNFNTSTTANNAGVQNLDLIGSANDIGKVVVFGGDAREMMLAGIERIAKAVSVTLGPKGRNVVIRLPNGEPKITKDGVTVARSITFRNQFEDVGARLVRQVASKTNDVAGDGTTTATVLAWSIFGEGYKAVATGANPMDLKRGIDTAVAVILESLKAQTRKVSGLDELINVATISANGERRLGEMIANAVTSVGVNGFISVLDGRTPKTEWQRHDGWSMESGFVDSALVTDQTTLTTKLEKEVLVFVTPQVLKDADDVLPALEAAAAEKRPLLIVAHDVVRDALDTIIENHTKGVVKCCIMAASRQSHVQQTNSDHSTTVSTAAAAAAASSSVWPFDEFRFVNDSLDDLAACCGCSAVDRSTLSRITNIRAVLGTASLVEQDMDSTVVVGTADVAARILFLQKKLERVQNEPERDSLRERIAKLNRTFAVIRVGGQTSVEIMESKDRVIDALNAARAALTDGIVGGGGSALLHASKQLDALLQEDEEMTQDRRTGIFIVRNAVRLPMRTIGDNAGSEGAVIVQNVLEEDDTAMGFDAQNNVYVNMFTAGIVDPTRVVACCIVDAASVAGLKITTEAIVCDDTGDVKQPVLSETVSLLSSSFSR